MEIIKFKKTNIKQMTKKSVVCFGIFDGIHLGHQEILNKALEHKENKKGVITFTNTSMFKGSKKIIIKKDKYDVFEKMGFDFILEIDMKQFSTLSYLEFIDLLKQHINIQTIIVGTNFKFGYKKEGTFFDLEKHFNEAIKVPLVKKNGAIISSTIIKYSIEEGSMELVGELLSKNFYYSGKVVKGKQQGRKMGTPTANVEWNNEIIEPKLGIYYSYAIFDNKRYASITSIGIRPSIDDKNKNVYETHLFNFDQEIYGEELKVELLKYIKPQIKHHDMISLQESIDKDKTKAKQYFINKKTN